MILIQIALSPRMCVAGAGVGVGGDRDERAEERDGPAERAARAAVECRGRERRRRGDWTGESPLAAQLSSQWR